MVYFDLEAMLSGRRTESFTFSDGSSRQLPRAKVVEYRDLSREKLDGVVFGATFDTMAECLDKLLFGTGSCAFL